MFRREPSDLGATVPHLDLALASSRPELLAAPVREALAGLPAQVGARIEVAPIDAGLADTAEFCAAYGVAAEDSANCLVVAGRRGQSTRYAACLVLATTRADVNGRVRTLLEARKASFAAMSEAVAATGMEYGGITPLGLPQEWRLLIDSRVLERDQVIVGAGIRGAKIRMPGVDLALLPGAEVIEDLAHPLRS